MFVNLKINKINEILISCPQITLKEEKKLKSKQTYIERSSFQYASYLRENWSHYEGTPPLYCGIVLEEAASWVTAGSSSWSAPNDRSSSLLEELTATMCSWRVVDFVLRIYINLMNNYIIKFLFLKKKIGNTSPILETTQIVQTCKYWQDICHKPVDFILFLPKILDYSISSHFQHDNIIFLIIK